ncbi:sulfatase [Polaribacter sp. BAL334]|uniref:sulfatase family protein n=1 Tax=Polaribacter sp. BAL334 TaxID=1708178 RepID=UPI0018D249AB|nr:sulfatase [Polaribacter sp. BAL334]MBG7611221.1 sulfatase [Polaribacter sp. BAL334]
MPKIRFFLYVVVFLVVNTNAQDKPNILWLTSEDNSVNWIGSYGNPYAETPNIDGLAEQGFRYTHCYANAPVCAPQRSSWITGVNAISMGTHHMRSRNNIPHDMIPYYPDALKKNKYYVANSKKTDYNIGGRDDKECWDNNSQPEVEWDILKANQPFFQIINFGESHESKAHDGKDGRDIEKTEHSPNDLELYAYHPDLPTIRKNYALYYDAIKKMDAKIGEAIQKLEELGLAENTIVIYNSDHGGVMPRSKRFLFKGGIHSPLIIRIPEKYKHLWPNAEKGTTVDRLVSFVDMPKTWLSLTGSEVPDCMQGNIFIGKEKEAEQPFHFAFRGRMDERLDNARAVYSKDFLYIRNYMPYVPWMQKLGYLWKAKAAQSWDNYVKEGKANEVQSKYFYPKMYSEEFYDLNNDPDNIHNLVGSDTHHEQIKKMREALRNWQLKIHDSGLLPESEMLKRASDHNTTIYQMVRNPELYSLPALLDAADVALEKKKENLPKLQKLLKSTDSGLRYWGIVGCFLLDDYKAAETVLNDDCDEVRAMAAWTLIRNKKKKKGLKCLQTLLTEKSEATLTVLNMIDWIDKDAKVLMNYIPEEEQLGDYEKRMLQILKN